MVMQFAKNFGAKVVAITAHLESRAGKLCDITVRLRGQVRPGREGEIPSVQSMATLFEQTIFVFEYIIIQLLMEKSILQRSKWQSDIQTLTAIWSLMKTMLD